MGSRTESRWATSEQWESHRNTISYLYRETSLRNIVEIMENEYRFFATPRMYKLRIQAWGLRKNISLIEAKETLKSLMYDQQSSEGERVAKLSCIHSYICRLPSDKREELMELYRQVVTDLPGEQPGKGPPTAIAMSLAAADDLQRVEQCIHHLRTYVLGCFGKGIWSKNATPEPRITVLLTGWYHASVTAQGALRRGRPAQAFTVLQPFFEQQLDALSSHDPRIFVCTIAFAVVVSATGPEVGAAALNFAAQISNTIYGQLSPYFVTMKLLAGMNSVDQRLSLRTLLHSYYQFIEDQVEPDDPLRQYLQQYHDAARIFILRTDLDGQKLNDNHRISQELDKIADTMCNPSQNNHFKVTVVDMVNQKPDTQSFLLQSREVIYGNLYDTVNLESHTQWDISHASVLRGTLVTLSLLTDLELSHAQNGDVVQADGIRRRLEPLLDVYCGILTKRSVEK
ncbi:hypothetical protein TruAng_011917 [Truncatella angustata]|nr:hypothetical protein TruAng_011917 [Truncatella angustata]